MVLISNTKTPKTNFYLAIVHFIWVIPQIYLGDHKLPPNPLIPLYRYKKKPSTKIPTINYLDYIPTIYLKSNHEKRE